MTKIKSCQLDSYRCVVTSHAFYEDKMASVTQCFFFTHDMVKFERPTFNRTDET